MRIEFLYVKANSSENISTMRASIICYHQPKAKTLWFPKRVSSFLLVGYLVLVNFILSSSSIDAFCLMSTSQIRLSPGSSTSYTTATTRLTLMIRPKAMKASGNSNSTTTFSEFPPNIKRSSSSSSSKGRLYKLPRTAYRIYTSYAKRLWNETNVDARRKIANDKVKGSIRAMQHVLRSNEYVEFSDGSVEARDRLLLACDEMLKTLPQGGIGQLSETTKSAIVDIGGTEAGSDTDKPVSKKPRRSILFGALMGLAVAIWVFSGNYIFTGLFCLMTILGQLEYYRMVMNTGVYPARRITIIGASSMFLTVRRPILFHFLSSWRKRWVAPNPNYIYSQPPPTTLLPKTSFASIH